MNGFGDYSREELGITPAKTQGIWRDVASHIHSSERKNPDTLRRIPEELECANWDESKHPRDKNGRFSGGNNAGANGGKKGRTRANARGRKAIRQEPTVDEGADVQWLKQSIDKGRIKSKRDLEDALEWEDPTDDQRAELESHLEDSIVSQWKKRIDKKEFIEQRDFEDELRFGDAPETEEGQKTVRSYLEEKYGKKPDKNKMTIPIDLGDTIGKPSEEQVYDALLDSMEIDRRLNSYTIGRDNGYTAEEAYGDLNDLKEFFEKDLKNNPWGLRKTELKRLKTKISKKLAPAIKKTKIDSDKDFEVCKKQGGHKSDYIYF